MKNTNSKTKKMSLKWRITILFSLLILTLVSSFLFLSLNQFNVVSKNIHNLLNSNKEELSQVSEDTKDTLYGNLEQIVNLVNNSFDVFFVQMENNINEIVSSGETQKLVNHSELPRGNVEGTGYENYPMWNKASLNEPVITYLGTFAKAHEEIQIAYYGMKDKATYIGPKLANEVDLREFDSTTREWYKGAEKDYNKVFWTNAYIDEISNEPVTTLSKAIVKNDKFIGVAGMDISLKSLTQMVQEIKVGKTGYVFISDANGVVLAEPKNKKLIGESIKKSKPYSNIFDKQSGMIEFKEKNTEKIGHYITNKKTGWKIVIVIDKSDLLASQVALDEFKKVNEVAIQNTVDKRNNLTIILFMVVPIFVLLGIACAFYISVNITKRINLIQEAMKKVSEGDLTVNLSEKQGDEIDNLSSQFNSMKNQLRTLIEKNANLTNMIEKSTLNLATISEETTSQSLNIADTISEIALSTEKQADDTQQVTVAVNELSQSIQRVNDVIFDTKETIELTSKSSEKGSTAVTDLESTSEENLKISEIAAININELSELVQEISSFTTTIKEISGKTNMLSFNASIEAAHAGATGRGFAVVADEVKKLADSSKNSADEINKIIQLVQEKLLATVEVFRTTEKVAKEQYNMVHRTKESFSDIKDSINEVMKRMNEVNQAIYLMNNKKEEIVDAIENISAISEQTAASTQVIQSTTKEQTSTINEIATDAQNLTEMAESLKKEIGKFKL